MLLSVYKSAALKIRSIEYGTGSASIDVIQGSQIRRILPTLGFHIAVQSLRLAHVRMTRIRAASVRGLVFTGNYHKPRLSHFFLTCRATNLKVRGKTASDWHSVRKTWFLHWDTAEMGTNQYRGTGIKKVQDEIIKMIWKKKHIVHLERWAWERLAPSHARWCWEGNDQSPPGQLAAPKSPADKQV
jgi:hypothetical protein